MSLVAIITAPVRTAPQAEPVRRIVDFLPTFDTGVVPPVDNLTTVAGVLLTTVAGIQLTTV